MNYLKQQTIIHNNYFKIIFIFLFIYNNHLFASTNHVPFNYGGELNTTFGRLAGVRSGGGRTSGYAWLSTYYKINHDYFITGNAGISFEGQSSYKTIINDASLGFHTPKSQTFVGQTLNASGKLHHDITDFGAPGGGSDNNPVSYFANGTYTTNVAQKLTLPFANRIAYYLKPYKDYLAIGISYAPNIGTYHPENYQFFSQTPINDEISIAGNGETYFRNLYLGFTSGYTQAYRPFNRFYPAGLVKATQYSFYLKEKLNKENFYNLYEINNGCLQDKNTNDCRTAFQFSKIKNRYIRNIGVQYRYNQNSVNPSINTDYFIGWSWAFDANVRIGFETILRQEEVNKNAHKKHIQNDFNWLTGIQYRF